MVGGGRISTLQWGISAVTTAAELGVEVVG